jgi:hypothetical protein
MEGRITANISTVNKGKNKKCRKDDSEGKLPGDEFIGHAVGPRKMKRLMELYAEVI